MQYMRMTDPSDEVEKELSCTCVRWCTSNEMECSVCGTEKNMVL